MENKKNFVNIIKDIIGDGKYLKLLEEISKENKEKVSLDEFYDVVVNNYCFLILMLGFSKRVDIDNYKLKTNNITLELNCSNFANKYKTYIKMVESEKFKTIRKML